MRKKQGRKGKKERGIDRLKDRPQCLTCLADTQLIQTYQERMRILFFTLNLTFPSKVVTVSYEAPFGPMWSSSHPHRTADILYSTTCLCFHS